MRRFTFRTRPNRGPKDSPTKSNSIRGPILKIIAARRRKSYQLSCCDTHFDSQLGANSGYILPPMATAAGNAAGAVQTSTMPDDWNIPDSLAYRKNRDAIWAGKPPAKYTRLVPFITRGPVVEIGAAEGVLSLLFAETGLEVRSVELRADRHAEACRLKARWLEMGRKVERCMMLQEQIADTTNLFDGAHCLLAVRVLYHLREDAHGIIARAYASGVERVVLCGNRARADLFAAGQYVDSLGVFNALASATGMVEILIGAGYQIDIIVDEGDPIVVGTHLLHSAS